MGYFEREIHSISYKIGCLSANIGAYKYVLAMYLIINWFYLLRNISGIVPEPKLKNRKTEKLNFPERSRKRFSIWIQFFSFSVFQFFSFSVFLTELFRNICGETEKLKNWILERDPGRDSPYGFSFWVFQFFCFSVLLTELFRNICGETEKLKTEGWWIEKNRNW